MKLNTHTQMKREKKKYTKISIQAMHIAHNPFGKLENYNKKNKTTTLFYNQRN